MEAVAVYSDADAEAAHVRLADLAVRLGPAPPTDSYLRIDRVVEAALRTGSRGGPSRLRVPRRAGRVRQGMRRRRTRVRWSAVVSDRGARRQAGGTPHRRDSGREVGARNPRAGLARSAGRGRVDPRARPGDRLSRDGQGGRRGRGPGDAPRRARPGPARCARRRIVTKRRRRSATGRSTSSA